MPTSKSTGKLLQQKLVYPTLETRKSYIFATNHSADNILFRQRKFKDALKKDGHQYAGGKIVLLSGTDTPKKTSSTPSKRKKKTNGTMEGDDTPSKKQKTKRDEDDIQDDEEQV